MFVPSKEVVIVRTMGSLLRETNKDFYSVKKLRGIDEVKIRIVLVLMHVEMVVVHEVVLIVVY